MSRKGETSLNYKCFICGAEPGKLCLRVIPVNLAGDEVEWGAEDVADYKATSPQVRELTCHTNREKFDSSIKTAAKLSDKEIRERDGVRPAPAVKSVQGTRLSPKTRKHVTPRRQTTMFGGGES